MIILFIKLSAVTVLKSKPKLRF